MRNCERNTVHYASPVFCVALFVSMSDTFSRNVTIVPGKRVGDVFIGQTLSTLEQRFGISKSGDLSMGRLWEVWTLDRQGGSIGVFCRRPDEHTFIVQRIRVTAHRFSTSNGLSVGSSLAEVQKAFPDVRLVSNYHSAQRHQKVAVYDSAKRGIAFEITADSPAPTARCVGVIIHVPGTAFAPSGDQARSLRAKKTKTEAHELGEAVLFHNYPSIFFLRALRALRG
jgi:hypothetical protein